MTLRARLAVALGGLTAVAVVTMAIVGYRTTANRLYGEVDRSLVSSASRFADPDGTYARLVCSQLASEAPVDEGQRLLADLPGTSVQCVATDGTVVARSSTDELPVDTADRQLAASLGSVRLRTTGDDRIATVPVTGGAVQLARDLDEVHNVLGSLRLGFGLIGAIVTAVAAAVGWLIARRVTRPITALTDATEEIVASGRLDVSVPTERHDEVGRLATSFATMLASLRDGRDQQQRLAQDAGHELRTPLTSLRANVDVLRRHPELAPAVQERVLDDIDSELRELSHVTNELVALVADDSADEPEQVVDVAALVERSARRIKRRWHRPVAVTVTGAALAFGRPRRLLRLFDNLLDNACKFDPSGAAIEVTVEPGRVEVRDHGPGVSAGDLGHVFDRFYRSAAARAMPGSGLGLSIAREVAAAHGGSLTVSNHPDGGALFTLTLPAVPADDDRDSHPGLTALPSRPYVEQPELPA